jgi:AraC-like DNA-binding protein
MSADTLSELLRAVRLRGAIFYYVDGIAPWVAEAPAAKEIVAAILPGAEHMIEYHVVTRGRCFGTLIGGSTVELREGDVIMFPQGDAHVMSSAPGMRVTNVDTAFYFSPRPPQLPYVLMQRGDRTLMPSDRPTEDACSGFARSRGGTSAGALSPNRDAALDESNSGVRTATAQAIASASMPPSEMTARLDGGGTERATVVCGFLGCDARPFNPLLAALPRMLHLPGAATQSTWISHFIRVAVEEANLKRPGGEAVLERLSEMMFVDVVRRYLETLPGEQTGWLAGLRDRFVGRALGLLHARPSHRWTIDELGDAVGLSRSALHERFAELVGQSPMQYLAQWRMQVASRLLLESTMNVASIALETGYESEAAFSRAFKRLVGMPPATWRRQRTTSSDGVRSGAGARAAIT